MLEIEDEDDSADRHAEPPQLHITEGRGRPKTHRIRPPTRTSVIADYLKTYGVNLYISSLLRYCITPI